MNKNKEALDELMNGIKYLIDNSKDNGTLILNGIIQSANADKTYNVKINGIIYENISSILIPLAVGNVVKVIVPQGQYSQMIIIGKINTNSGGGGAPYTLPTATNTVLGGVKIGANLSMDTDGHLSAPAPVTVDDALNLASENPVQNKVVTQRLDEVFTSVSNGKALVAGAITDKGVQTASDATFEQMADNIALISSVIVRIDVENRTFKNVSESMGYVYYKSWWGGREGYRAFDGNEGTQWCCAWKDSMQGEYLAYVFDQPIYLKKFKGYIKNAQGSNPVFKLQATLAYTVDDAVWVDLTDDIALAPENNRLEFDFPQGEMYAAYRLYWSAGKQDSSAGCDVWEINLQGYYYEQM